MALAGTRTSTRRASATPLAHDGQLPRNHLGLERRCELLRFVEPQPEVGQARLLATLNARDLGLGRHAGLQLRHQLHTPYQLRHQAHPLSVSLELTREGTNPHEFACSPCLWHGYPSPDFLTAYVVQKMRAKLGPLQHPLHLHR